MQMAINSDAPKRPRKQSLAQIITGSKVPDNSGLKVAAQVDIRFTNGVCNEEFEFELNEDFHGIEFQVLRKGKHTLATYFLPYLSLEPDEDLHEEWFTLYSDNTSKESGHTFTSAELESARPCYLCKKILSPDVISDKSIVKCMKCGMVCDEDCMPNITATCSMLPSARIAYVYTREKILVSY
jgi:hypothetical protein